MVAGRRPSAATRPGKGTGVFAVDPGSAGSEVTRAAPPPATTASRKVVVAFDPAARAR